MNTITFQAKLSENSKIRWSRSITSVDLTQESYEVEVTARGSSFHLLIGSHAYGNYICIPNWNIGTELAELNDFFWNCERLRNATTLKKVDACSVAYALVELSKYIRL